MITKSHRFSANGDGRGEGSAPGRPAGLAPLTRKRSLATQQVKENEMQYEHAGPNELTNNLEKMKVPRDYILAWCHPEVMGTRHRFDVPVGRCYLRLQTMDRWGKWTRVFFSVVQEEAPAVEPHLLWLAAHVARLFSLDVFDTRWFLHTPAGLHGRSVDAFDEMAFDWFALGGRPAVRTLQWQDRRPIEARPVELPGLYESDKELIWISDTWPAGHGHCGLRLYEGGAESEAPAQQTVILTNHSGASVMNALEEIAFWVSELFGLSWSAVTWVTHFEKHPLSSEGAFTKAWLKDGRPVWKDIALREGRALLAHSRSFQLPLGPVAPMGNPFIAGHLQYRKGQGLGAGRHYAGDVDEYGSYVFVHEDGRCRRLQNVFELLYGQLFLWGDNTRGSDGLAYSILADLRDRATADRYWKAFHEEVIARLAADEDFTLAHEEVEAWLKVASTKDKGVYLN